LSFVHESVIEGIIGKHVNFPAEDHFHQRYPIFGPIQMAVFGALNPFLLNISAVVGNPATLLIGEKTDRRYENAFS